MQRDQMLPPPNVTVGEVYWYDRRLTARTTQRVLVHLELIDGYGGYGEMICPDGETISGGVYLPSLLLNVPVEVQDLKRFTVLAVKRLSQHLQEKFALRGQKLAKAI
ncbi:MAG: hypothetical protein PHW95_02300 [Patescibacteria group bacterium]|nr:hypothetical protein [Patescibacteria group bacterium]